MKFTKHIFVSIHTFADSIALAYVMFVRKKKRGGGGGRWKEKEEMMTMK